MQRTEYWVIERFSVTSLAGTSSTVENWPVATFPVSSQEWLEEWCEDQYGDSWGYVDELEPGDQVDAFITEVVRYE